MVLDVVRQVFKAFQRFLVLYTLYLVQRTEIVVQGSAGSHDCVDRGLFRVVSLRSDAVLLERVNVQFAHHVAGSG